MRYKLKKYQKSKTAAFPNNIFSSEYFGNTLISTIVNLLGTVISDFPIKNCTGPMDSI